MISNIVNKANLDAARVGFHAAFLQSLEAMGPDALESLYTEISSTTAIEEWSWMGDLPGLEEWKGDRNLAALSAHKLRIENKSWASGLRIHENDIKDDRLGLIAPQIAGLADKARKHRSDLMVKMLLNGFAGNAYPETGNGLCYTGSFFFSDSHSVNGGATFDNKATSALDATSLIAAELQLASMKTYDGADPLEISGTHLIVGPKLRATAEKLMLSEYLPSSAGTATESNYLKGRYQILVSPRITGTYDDYWFLADLSKAAKPMLFQMREELSPAEVTDSGSLPVFQRGEYWFGAQARYNVGYFEPRLIIGSAV